MLNLLLAVVVSASIDSTQLQLGDQTKMHVEVTQDPTEQIAAPSFKSQLPQGLEEIYSSPVDTTKLSNGRIRWEQDVTITGFAADTFAIRPYVVRSSGDTLFAQTSQLIILMPDSIGDIHVFDDIKDIEDVPIWIWDILKWVLLGIGCLILVGVSTFITIYTMRKKRKVIPLDPIVLRPAEEVALERLTAIQAAKIWQQGKNKQYHTELTDVIRTYIGRRFDIHSTEKTSDETLRAIRPLIDREIFNELSQMLQLADFVKFAKYQPMADENEKALDAAFHFVRVTSDKG